jgi:hypothetical protein
MTTDFESASKLYAALRPYFTRLFNHTAEAEVLLIIRNHIRADRHEQAVEIAKGASNLMDTVNKEGA